MLILKRLRKISPKSGDAQSAARRGPHPAGGVARPFGPPAGRTAGSASAAASAAPGEARRPPNRFEEAIQTLQDQSRGRLSDSTVRSITRGAVELGPADFLQRIQELIDTKAIDEIDGSNILLQYAQYHPRFSGSTFPDQLRRTAERSGIDLQTRLSHSSCRICSGGIAKYLGEYSPTC